MKERERKGKETAAKGEGTEGKGKGKEGKEKGGKGKAGKEAKKQEWDAWHDLKLRTGDWVISGTAAMLS